MLSKTYRGFQPRTRLAGKALLSYTADKVENSIVDSRLILSNDLYKSNPQINSLKKIPYYGTKPSFYRRSTIDFLSEYLDPQGPGDNRILEVLDLDVDFETSILPRTDKIQKFVGDEFPLTLHEKLSILCGLSNFSLTFQKESKDCEDSEISKNPSPQRLFPASDLMHGNEYNTEKLRLVGRAIFDLHVGLGTIFINENYLSLPSENLEQTMSLFNDERAIIPLFMKRNYIYDSVFRYRGAMKSGIICSGKEYEETKLKIQDVTSIGSFYTMIGILAVKFNKEDVLAKVVYGKILNGQTGLINIATESLTKFRT